jgi:hypothetical protein
LCHEVREEPAGTGGEVGLVVCKPGGRAAGETGDEAACVAAPAPAGAGRRQPAEPAASGRIVVGRLGQRQAVCASCRSASAVGAARHFRGLRGAPRPATRRPTR